MVKHKVLSTTVGPDKCKCSSVWHRLPSSKHCKDLGIYVFRLVQ